MSKDEIKLITLELLDVLDDFNDINLGRIGKFDPNELSKAFTYIFNSVKEIENYSKTVRELTGEQRKEVVVSLLNDVINIPLLPEYIEGVLISWSIDLLVDAFNKLGGEEWIDTLFGND